MAFPTSKSNLVDNVDDVMADHVNNLEDKTGIDWDTEITSLDHILRSGWIPISTLTRVSDSSATLSGDWTNRIGVGDKIHWLSNGSPRYNYVIGVSYSAPNTTIKIVENCWNSTGGDSIFTSGETITSPFISKVANPQGFPGIFRWQPTYTGFSTAPSNVTATFVIDGRMVTVCWRAHTAGVSNSNLFRIESLPVPSITLGEYLRWSAYLPWVMDNETYINVTTGHYAWVAPNSSRIEILKNRAYNAWTTSGNKLCEAFSISYRFQPQ